MIRALGDLFKTALAEWWEDNTFRLAASLAFYTIFSLAPILLISVEVAGFVFSKQEARQQIISQAQELVGNYGGETVAQVLNSLGSQGGNPWAVAFGIIATLVGSTAVFAELQAALNQIWDVQVDPNRSMVKGLLRARLRSFTLVLAVGFLLMVSLVISAVLSAAQAYLSNQIGIPWIWRIANFMATLLVITLLFAMIYRYLPDVKITWKDVGIGALVTALLFSLGKWLIGLYLGQTAFASSYGAAGSFVVLLLWVYYSALISFFGAEFTQVYARRFGSRIRPERHAVRVGKKADTV